MDRYNVTIFENAEMVFYAMGIISGTEKNAKEMAMEKFLDLIRLDWWDVDESLIDYKVEKWA